jgi:hypothetical protein
MDRRFGYMMMMTTTTAMMMIWDKVKIHELRVDGLHHGIVNHGLNSHLIITSEVLTWLMRANGACYVRLHLKYDADFSSDPLMVVLYARQLQNAVLSLQ